MLGRLIVCKSKGRGSSFNVPRSAPTVYFLWVYWNDSATAPQRLRGGGICKLQPMSIKFDKRNYRKHDSRNKQLIRKSLEECGAGRSVLIDADDSLIAGNGVYEQAQKLGIPVQVVETDGSSLVVVKRTDLHADDERRKKLAFADNATGDTSEWDVEAIRCDLSDSIVKDWGVSLPEITMPGEEHDEQKPEDPKARAKGRNLHWGKSRGDKDVARCNLVEKPQIHFRGAGAYLASFHRSAEGVPLTEIKAPEQVELFADMAVKLIRGLVGAKHVDDMCIITTPRRRHTDWNFADEICKLISSKTGIHYEPDVVTCKNRRRIDPTFEVQKKPSQKTLILYDDIVTTGATLCAMQELFADYNLVTVIGICNLTT